MAILNTLTASVVVNGADLKEYDHDDDQPETPNSLTRYIEASSGANFAIKYRFDHPLPEGCDGFNVALYLDGTEVEDVLPHISTTHSSMGIRELNFGKTVLRKYKFADIEIGKLRHPPDSDSTS